MFLQRVAQCLAAQAALSWLVLVVADRVVDLPFGDINVMIVTDVHSWISGHKHEPAYDANYGDVLSLHERIKEDCDKNGRDLFFVMNGDFNDGTGLSTDPPIELVPLLETMPWDAVTIGNHELYENEFIHYIMKPDNFVTFWGDRYLTANVVNASTGEPLGRTHKFLRGQFGTTLLTFGFLYNMPDHDSAVDVLRVEEVVQQKWFLDVLSGAEGGFDAVLVLAHMDYKDPLVSVILDAIRRIQPAIPVQFVTGHSHIRGYTALDMSASSFEAGHYLDTVGFASFPKNGTSQKESVNLAAGFQHVFIDANTATFKTIVGAEDFLTDAGKAFAKRITETRESMKLSQQLGCAPIKFDLVADFTQNNSLWKLFMQDVIAGTLFKSDTTKVFLQSTGSMRYDLYQGNVTKDDIVTMSPFRDAFWLLGQNVSGSMIVDILARLNAGSKYALPPFVSTPFKEVAAYDLYGGSFDVGTLSKPGDLLKTMFSLSTEPVIPAQQFIGKTTTKLWYDFVPLAWPCSKSPDGIVYM